MHFSNPCQGPAPWTPVNISRKRSAFWRRNSFPCKQIFVIGYVIKMLWHKFVFPELGVSFLMGRTPRTISKLFSIICKWIGCFVCLFVCFCFCLCVGVGRVGVCVCVGWGGVGVCVCVCVCNRNITAEGWFSGTGSVIHHGTHTTNNLQIVFR